MADQASLVKARAWLALCASLVSALLASAPAGASGEAGPTLSLSSRTPIVVRGRHFRPGEHVRVTLRTQVTRRSRATTDSLGRFSARFRGTTVPRCGGLRVRAVGDQGSVATLKIPLPGCLPA